MVEMTYPRIIGQRPGGALLVALDAQSGCVYEPAQRIVYPRLPLASLMAQPYWRPYHGHGAELRDWPGPPLAQAPAPPPPVIPPIPGLRPLTAAEGARLQRMAERGQRAEEAAQELTQQQQHDKETPDHG